MSEKTLFIAWQDQDGKYPRPWFPIGRLDADVERPLYRFRYTGGAQSAQNQVGFSLPPEFPGLRKAYESDTLFPIFKNRVMSPRRPDFPEYLSALDIPKTATSIDVLAANGGRKMTDAYEVFPKIDKHPDGAFSCRFFLSGWRDMPAPVKSRIETLKQCEELRLALDMAHQAPGLAVQIQTTDCISVVIGWTPQYLAEDLAASVPQCAGEFAARVARVNPSPVPASQRVLIELSGNWNGHEPMSGPDFQPLVD